jgi:hypothetical protein
MNFRSFKFLAVTLQPTWKDGFLKDLLLPQAHPQPHLLAIEKEFLGCTKPVRYGYMSDKTTEE